MTFETLVTARCQGRKLTSYKTPIYPSSSLFGIAFRHTCIVQLVLRLFCRESLHSSLQFLLQIYCWYHSFYLHLLLARLQNTRPTYLHVMNKNLCFLYIYLCFLSSVLSFSCRLSSVSICSSRTCPQSFFVRSILLVFYLTYVCCLLLSPTVNHVWICS